MLIRQIRTPIRLLAASAGARRAASINLRRASGVATAPEDDLRQIQPRTEPAPVAFAHDTDKARRISFLYFANVFPLRMGLWDLRSYFAKVRRAAADLKSTHTDATSNRSRRITYCRRFARAFPKTRSTTSRSRLSTLARRMVELSSSSAGVSHNSRSLKKRNLETRWPGLGSKSRSGRFSTSWRSSRWRPSRPLASSPGSTLPIYPLSQDGCMLRRPFWSR